MKRVSFLLLCTFSSLCIAADKNSTTSSPYGELSGQVRMYHIFPPAYIKNAPKEYAIDASAIGAHLKYKTPTFYNFGLSTALYHARELHNNSLNSDTTIVGAGRFFSDDLSPQTIATENQLFYQSKKHKLTLGQQIYDSPMTKEIVTFLPNVFMGISYTHTYTKKSQFTFSHLNAMAFGSRAPVDFGLIGEGTNTAGATQNALDSNTNKADRGSFKSVEAIALGKDVPNTKGLVVFGLDHQFNQTNSMRLWNYYADNIMNMLYVEVEHKWKVGTMGLKFNVQYLREDQIGDKLGATNSATGSFTNFDAQSSYLYGVKLSFQKEKLKGVLGYNHSGDARIFNPWGGDPAYTSSFFSRNAYRADVDAYKLTLNYSMTEKASLITHYADYGTSNTLGNLLTVQTDQAFVAGTQRAIETALLLSYKPTKAWHIFTGFIYKTSEYLENGEPSYILDADLVITYTF